MGFTKKELEEAEKKRKSENAEWFEEEARERRG
jgi:hypothetical protein